MMIRSIDYDNRPSVFRQFDSLDSHLRAIEHQKAPRRSIMSLTMTSAKPLSRRLIQILCILLLIVVVDARSPGWGKFSTAIKHQNIASRNWRTSSDDVRLIASRKKNRAAVVEETATEIREPSVLERVLFGGFVIAGTTAMEYAR